MKVRKIFAVIVAVMLVLTLASVVVQAAIPTELPDGVVKVISASSAGTRNPAWKADGIISLPLGEDFDNGGTNHGVYSIEYPCKEGDIFYTYWIIKVEKNDDADGSDILSHDPAWKNGGSELSTGTSNYLLEDEGFEEGINYDDITPDKWDIAPCGFEVSNADCTKVELRLHYKNVAAVQFKYLVITSKPMNFNLNAETGEIDGITNENTYVPATAAPTPSQTTAAPTTAAATTAPATEAATTTAAPTTAAATSTSTNTGNDDGANIGLIIGISAGVVAVGGIGAFFLLKKKK